MVKSSSLSRKISDRIREHGALTVAAFMELALYDTESGYYARAARRSGRAGDFFSSVDVGPIFGELLAVQIAEMARLVPSRPFDLVEAAAGNGRLSADILRAVRRVDADLYDRIRLHLVERSEEARAMQRDMLGEVGDRLFSSSAMLPDSVEGVILANELLDAMPAHQVVMREAGLREIYVTVSGRAADPSDNHRFALCEGPPSTPALAAYLDRLGITLGLGWRVEINLLAVDWIRDVSRRLRRGFVLLIDYGHEARELYSVAHSSGTLTSFARHVGGETHDPRSTPLWLDRPGQRDITAHVDFTSVRGAAETEGLSTIGLLDQTYFLIGIVAARADLPEGAWHAGNLEENPKSRRALATLVMPGGLGSTHKVLILAKDVGTPRLIGCSYRMRVT